MLTKTINSVISLHYSMIAMIVLISLHYSMIAMIVLIS